MHLAIVLLHYNNIKVTQWSISHIKKIREGNSLNLVVVDNDSPNGSGAILKNNYAADPFVHIIISDTNLGFARGNNLGYSYAKNILLADTIIVMNNDVYIKDSEFICKIKKIQEQFHSELIAPDIVGKNDNHQNPFRYERISDKKLKFIYLYNEIVNTIYKIPLLNFILAFFLDHKKHRIHAKEQQVLSHIVPHGACIIYLSGWVSKEDIAFVPETFMYLEEDVLADYLFYKNYSCIYTPQISVIHEEDASTDSINKKSIKKRLFISKHLKDSAKILIQMRAKRE